MARPPSPPDAKLKQNVSESPFRTTDEVTQAKKKFGCFFNDGLRRVDYVLVWEEPIEPDDDEDQKRMQLHAAYRRKFEENLHESGVQLEREVSIAARKVHFVKLFVTWATMCSYAEYLGFRAPIERYHSRRNRWVTERMHKTFTKFTPMVQKVPRQPKNFLTTTFSTAKLKKFLGNANQDSYFRPTQRFEVAREILGTMVYGRKELSEVGLERMIREGIYTSAYPPHEGDWNVPLNSAGKDLNTRQILHTYWARWNLWFKYQPLNHVREYFGEKIAFYFAYMGCYTAWLVPASAMGLISFLYSLYVMEDSEIVKDSCGSQKNFKMCPLCDENPVPSANSTSCGYWYLSDICYYIKAAYLFDNDSTVVYSMFVSFWACAFLEYWKRSSAALAYSWDVFDFVDVQERPRPEYTARCTEYAEDPVSGNMEPHFPMKKQLPRLILGALSVIFMMVLSTGCLLAMLMVRALLLDHLFENELLRSRALLMANIISAIINLVMVLALELLYEKWAYTITEWEMHRTQTQFENKLILKVFIFELFNHYSSISYTALIKGYIAGKPGNYNTLLGKRLSECSHGGCMLEVTQVLAVITIGKQLAINIIEVILPRLMIVLHRAFHGLKLAGFSDKQWEMDYGLMPYDQTLFMEYLEVIMQFGFITVFVPAFPLAPLFALINNIVEIRLDARKLVCRARRPQPERTQGIGVWFSMLEFMVHLCTLSNAFMMAFTSEFLPTVMYRIVHDKNLKGYKNFTLSWASPNTTHQACRYSNLYTEHPDFTEYYWKLMAVRLAFAIIYQQLVATMTRVISYMIPDITEELDMKIKRQKYLAKQAMVDVELRAARRHARTNNQILPT